MMQEHEFLAGLGPCVAGSGIRMGICPKPGQYPR